MYISKSTVLREFHSVFVIRTKNKLQGNHDQTCVWMQWRVESNLIVRVRRFFLLFNEFFINNVLLEHLNDFKSTITSCAFDIEIKQAIPMFHHLFVPIFCNNWHNFHIIFCSIQLILLLTFYVFACQIKCCDAILSVTMQSTTVFLMMYFSLFIVPKMNVY